ncbi:MAG: ribosome small subunit-dependent GTPase A [Flavobacteriaceae bacterium CG_4_8_14_3_um_filter_34_10]|nr:ribosome small subunit-dependent GTPase A [Flavobacteriia bacterium]OIP49590.1 MAG: ribosome small subunit-dependent GTPase A [Flavobacteriaceae bacterium CG2_30_34_30]PIQ18562.1 MAG: ribosome small subunit-dependent GTPase A [Flavobacteriaceae bacterium CG18_big_fil_WC_8_21_14_2_50_34_36]PIV49016.1 MAG: ribosome small subunit-dependent GTPase A [Flavobacteriaceae bacterium CG02_land_8_20_14_3_00_34_13]PIX09088.1 MAG: ribosome small subunit-dependent GTPase A [Flavobacteriaceae bacterium CG_
MKGTVYKSTGSWYTVKAENGTFYDCRIKGKFRIRGIKSTNPIAVGDRVSFQLDTKGKENQGVISDIEERDNYIVRKSVNLSKKTHIIAANIDQLLLVITLNNPPTFTSFIDRFLVTAEAYHIKTILLFNKIDTYTEEELLEIKFLTATYKNIGYECLSISAITGENMDVLKKEMVGKVSIFAGHSGVGKSTLINTLDPSVAIKTKQISEQHQQGQHTTTFAEMYDLPFDAKIIDTPGVKGFGVVDMEKEELTDYFPEFLKLKQQCKFHNCSHIHEPNCAVKEALEKEKVAWSRYRSYVQLLEGEDENYRTDIWEQEN